MAGFWFHLKANETYRFVSWLVFSMFCFFFYFIDFRFYYDCFGPDFTFGWLIEIDTSVRGVMMDSSS